MLREGWDVGRDWGVVGGLGEGLAQEELGPGEGLGLGGQVGRGWGQSEAHGP